MIKNRIGKYLKILGIFVFSFLMLFFIQSNLSDTLDSYSISPEIQIHSLSLFGNAKSKAIAASCGFTLHGSADEFTSCNITCPTGETIAGTSQCGGVCAPNSGNTCPIACNNGATNRPQCNQCASGSTWNGSSCSCNNAASNAPSCNICPAGLIMQNNLCVCANGATNPTTCNICPIGSNMTNGQCSCANGADIQTQCNSCRAVQVMDANGQCKDTCSTTNICGQTSQGFMNAGRCEVSTANGQDSNASCIVDFNVTTNSVNANGSVEFSWSLANLPSNIRSQCGFVDLTTPTPRPIPGLQNLSPETDRVRINNVQATTRFCLVCQFYNLTSGNSLLGEAAKHQWVRVIRVGEN